MRCDHINFESCVASATLDDDHNDVLTVTSSYYVLDRIF